MSGPGAALRELGERSHLEGGDSGMGNCLGCPRKGQKALWGGAEGGRGGRVGCWVGEEARVL